jgi:hypothetical protein
LSGRPSVSVQPAGRIALTTGQADWGPVERIRFVLFDKRALDVFVALAAELDVTVVE